jgi:hypothetical protein
MKCPTLLVGQTLIENIKVMPKCTRLVLDSSLNRPTLAVIHGLDIRGGCTLSTSSNLCVDQMMSWMMGVMKRLATRIVPICDIGSEATSNGRLVAHGSARYYMSSS